MASIIKADNIQKVSDGSNIIKKCGSTITLGSCGATIALACGATQTGFGQTYSAVEYCTTAKTSPFTAAAGTGYFINTTCGAVTVTLPASPTAGDVVAFKDYAGQWNTNAVTLCNNGNKINGVCAAASLSTQNQSVSLIYVDATKGWQDIQDSTAGVTGADYIIATGGTITTCGDFKIHAFTSDGCFSVSCAGSPVNNLVDYLVVAGGGGGGRSYGGGGAAGGFRVSNSYGLAAPTMSPLTNPTGLPVSITTYPVTVGAGGVGGSPGPTTITSGSNSIFSTITSTGGGRGGDTTAGNAGLPGGSGGGGRSSNPTGGTGGSGNTPPTSPSQGNNGGSGATPCTGYGAGGGGGAGAVGVVGNPITPTVASGGVGSYVSPSFAVGCAGTTGPVCGVRYFAGGGGGAGDANRSTPATSSTGAGGAGGGGAGGVPNNGSHPGPAQNRSSVAGGANTGGGGGGGAYCGTNYPSSSGGSGIVIIRYKFQ
jgi:hypothetical protein